MRPIAGVPASVNHIFPFESGAMSIATALERKPGVCPAVKTVNVSEFDRSVVGPGPDGARSVETPLGPEHAATAASATSAIRLCFIIIGYLPTVMRPTAAGRALVNHIRPSGPAAICSNSGKPLLIT